MNELPVTRPLSSLQCNLGMRRSKHDDYEQERLCGFYSLSTFTGFNRVQNEVYEKFNERGLKQCLGFGYVSF